jgi:hypothetical protein
MTTGTDVRRVVLSIGVAVSAALLIMATPAAASMPSSFISQFSKISTLSTTVPGNGDVNPYGVAVVPDSMGTLHAGDVLVSNFNAKSNEQGTGTTIVDISPMGAMRVFAHINGSNLPGSCPGGVGLTTALNVLPNDWVVVGSLPTSNGMAATAKAGCLIVLNSSGHAVETWSGAPINGPWDMTEAPASYGADLYVTNVLNGTVAAKGMTVDGGTVVRIRVAIHGASEPQRMATDVIATGFAEHTDPAALVVGPTGVALAPNGDLYVADAVNNRIAEIDNAPTRMNPVGRGGVTVSMGGHLSAPLGLTLAPNGDILTVNGADGRLVETTPAGTQFKAVYLDKVGTPPGSGALFGLALAPHGIYFVDDVANTLNLFH